MLTQKDLETASLLPTPQFLSTYLPSGIPPFAHSTDPTITYDISLHEFPALPKTDFEDCFSLVKATSADAYKRSDVGWNPRKKRKEMREVGMKCLVVRQRKRVAGDVSTSTPSLSPSLSPAEEVSSASQATPTSSASSSLSHQDQESDDSEGGVLAFTSFLLTIEDNFPVIYCYEIHLSPSVRSLGLGKYLMSLLEQLGRNIGVEKSMLTVFLRNTGGVKFYRRIGYEEDPFSPKPKRLRSGGVKRPSYIILSKSLR